MAQQRASIEAVGLEDLKRTLDDLRNSLAKDQLDAQLTGAMMVAGDAQKRIAKRSMGRMVTRTRANGNEYDHIASAPGDAPNTDTGRLIGSIMTEPLKDGAIVGVGTNVKYAFKLEFGDSKMAARPFLIPAFESQKSKIIRMLKRVMRGTISKYEQRN